MEFAVVTPRSRCSHGVYSRVFGRGIQESEIAELHISRTHTDLTLVSKWAYHCIGGSPGEGAMK